MNSVAITRELIKAKLGGKVEVNPKTGNLRFISDLNYVMEVVDVLGGVSATAERLKVPQLEVERWIDQHFIPAPFAEDVHKLTGYTVEGMQEPIFWFEVDGQFWPLSGYLTANRSRAMHFKYPGW
jgi:hypothetical protein